MDFDKMTDDQLAWLMAERRGRKPVVNRPFNNGYEVSGCPCPGMPHGVHIKGHPPRLHKFPRDVMLGFLRMREKEGIAYAYDGVVVCKFVVDKTGQILFRSDTPAVLQNYSFALLMRGAAAEMDDHYAMLAGRYSNRKSNFDSDDGMDSLMGGADGVGQPGS